MSYRRGAERLGVEMINQKFDRCLGSTAAEPPVEFQTNTMAWRLWDHTIRCLTIELGSIWKLATFFSNSITLFKLDSYVIWQKGLFLLVTGRLIGWLIGELTFDKWAHVRKVQVERDTHQKV